MAKLTSSERQVLLKVKLDEQRHLLRKSIDGLAVGDLAEALRVSTILRILMHESGSTKPLLKQLATDYLNLEILDTPPPSAGAIFSIPVSFRISSEGVYLNPRLSDERVPAPLGRWWERPCLILMGLGGFSRRELVLGLANKEGGAHIDLSVSNRYGKLLEYKSFQMGPSQSECSAINLSRLMVGQAGVEMLDCLQRNFPPLFKGPANLG
jgi:hypothetical protein